MYVSEPFLEFNLSDYEDHLEVSNDSDNDIMNDRSDHQTEEPLAAVTKHFVIQHLETPRCG